MKKSKEVLLLNSWRISISNFLIFNAIIFSSESKHWMDENKGAYPLGALGKDY